MTADPHALRARDAANAFGACALTWLVFARALTCGFVNFDDTIYVTQNPSIQRGLTPETFAWAWTAVVGAQRYPLTLLSHLLDVTIFGLNPAGHHITSVLIHGATTGLLYLALVRLAGRRGIALAVSLLFALHPLRVESVAWIAERKDVLAAFFWVAAILAYAGYAARPGIGRYAAVAAAMAAGLLSKPMAVTLPAVLLLLDAWPLARFGGQPASRRLAVLTAEKLPLFALSIASGVSTLFTQSGGGAIAGLESTPLAERLLNAIGSYWVYVQQTFAPIRLAVFYPMPPPALLIVNAGLGVLLLAGGGAIAYRLRYRRPALGVGGLWFALSLLPVIGLVQVGAQSHADRYTYIPSIGLLMAIVWPVAEFLQRVLPRKRAGILAVALLALAWLTWDQIGRWRSSETLFAHALRVTENNARAEDYYGQALLERGNESEAIDYFQRSIRLEPGNPQPRHNLVVALDAAGNHAAALSTARETLAFAPNHVPTLFYLGSRALVEDRLDEALADLESAARLSPRRADVRVNLGICYGRLGRVVDAEAQFRAAIAANPQYAPAYLNLGVAAHQRGDRDSARKYFSRALEVQPDYEAAKAALLDLEKATR